MNSAVKSFEMFFFNSLKLTIKNFGKFFTAEFIEKNFENFELVVNFRLFKKNSKFYTAEFIEKNFKNFFGKFEKKNIFPQKERGGNPNNFSRKIRHDLSLGFDISFTQVKAP